MPRAVTRCISAIEGSDREDACLRRYARKLSVGSYNSGNRGAMHGRFRFYTIGVETICYGV